MIFFKYFLVFILAFQTLYAEASKPDRCGTKPPTLEEQFHPQERSISDCTTSLTKISDEYWPKGLYLQIPIWFHVIHKSDGTGTISDARIQAQIQALNEDFRASKGTKGSGGYDAKIQFTLAGITRTENYSWFVLDLDSQYKPALAVDTNRYVNIYTTTADGALGYAYFPQGSAGTTHDGIVLLHSSVGGRDNGFSQYDQGRTLVHEMGHYLGLYHTFQGGSECLNDYQNGDRIADTNAESQSHGTCVQTTTCGTNDPITNYMNYTPDSCMIKFSAEQANRMVCSTMNYRPDVFTLIQENTSNTLNFLPSLLAILL